MKFLNAVLIVLSLTLFACVSDSVEKTDDRKLFDKVSSKLEKGGSYFNFQSNKYVFKAIESSYLHVPEAIKVIVPSPQQQVMPLMIYKCLKPLNNSLGIHEMLAAGASSILIAEKTEKNPALFRSRQFIYYGDKQPKGLIWDFMAGENAELNTLATLPKETLFASSSESAPGKIWSKLKIIFSTLPFPPIQRVPMIAEQTFLSKFKFTLPAFLDSLSGTYSTIIVSAKSAKGKPALYAMLKIPNKNNLVFKVLSKLAKSQAGLQVLPNEISPTIPIPLTWI
ncbi:MAG: hypothetical protein KOO69_04240, partial [Victivallales bacterium]|nr:hypothetical protein [Victivallales bacterium]